MLIISVNRSVSFVLVNDSALCFLQHHSFYDFIVTKARGKSGESDYLLSARLLLSLRGVCCGSRLFTTRNTKRPNMSSCDGFSNEAGWWHFPWDCSSVSSGFSLKCLLAFRAAVQLRRPWRHSAGERRHGGERWGENFCLERSRHKKN